MARYERDDFDEVLELDVRRRGSRFDMPHSGAGVAALTLGAIAAVGAACAVAIVVTLETVQPAPGLDDDLWLRVLGLLVVTCGMLAIAGFAAGLAGAAQSDRNPLLGIAGTVANALAILGMIVVICSGVLSDF